MAVYFEQYNPWREQLAGSILAPLLKMAIEGSQAANQSRKENAFISEAMKEFQPQVDTSMPTLPALQELQAPLPSSPWAQAADSQELTQGFSPAFEAQAMQSPARDMREIQARLAELQASPRFNMLNPDRTRQLLAPMMDQYAAAENARKMQDFFAQFEGMQDPFERLLLMGQGAGMKYLPDNALSNYVDLYKHQTPHQDFKLVDSGDKVTGYAFDPADGAVSEVLSRAAGMNPYQAGSLANERSRIGISAGNLGLAREKWEWEKAHGGVGGGSGGMPYQFLQDPEGNFVRANKRTGELEPTDVSGLVRGSPYERMPEIQKAQAQMLRDRIFELGKDKRAIMNSIYGDPESNRQQIAAIDEEITRTREELARFYGGQGPESEGTPQPPATTKEAERGVAEWPPYLDRTPGGMWQYMNGLGGIEAFKNSVISPASYQTLVLGATTSGSSKIAVDEMLRKNNIKVSK